jgi:CubicO group peptidase (beta-lactamase class C family)
MTIPRSTAATAAIIALCRSLAGTPAYAQSLSRLDSVVPAMMKRWDVPGVAIAVVRGDSIVALQGFGLARVRDSARIDPHRTLFRLASVSKLFVATGAVQQMERGAVDARADVGRYLDFSIPATWPQPITLEHLLTHTAGFDERLIGYAARSRDSIGGLGAHLASNLPYRGWPPGDVIGYSNYGMALAAYVVERASGLPFDRYARERIFAPLGMDRTFYIRVPDSLRADVAEGHFCDETRCTTAPDVYTHPYPIGLAYSSAADMAQFLVAQLRAGASRAGRGLDTASVALMQRQHVTADTALPGMSYAFFNQRHRGHRVLTHGGSIPGINSLLFLVPDAPLGVYIVANGGRTAFGAALRDTLLALFVPPAVVARPRAATLDERYVASLGGSYQITRYAHRTIESFPSLFATSIPIRARGSRLVLPYPNAPVEFEPVDSLHFREVGGERVIAFRRDGAGRVTRLAAPIPFFGAEIPGVLERQPWYEGAHFMNEYISWLLLGPLLILVAVWPVALAGAWWLRRRRGRGADSGLPGERRTALGVALAFNALWAAFGFLVIARSARMFERANGIVFGVTPSFRAASVVPWLLAGLATFMVVAAIRAWPRQLWDPVRRTLYGLATVGALLVIAFLIRWNYLPMRF